MANSFIQLYHLNRDALAICDIALNQKNYRALFQTNIHHSLPKFIKDQRKIKRVNTFKRKCFARYYESVRLYPFSKALVLRLRKIFRLGIISSTSKARIETVLEKKNLKKYFSVIHGSRATSKKREIVRAIHSMRSTPRKSFLISDTAGDIRVGNKLGLKTVAVTWGFHSRNNLKKTGPERIFSSWKKMLLYLINSHSNLKKPKWKNR